jgi:hypothetical protein
VDVSDLAVIDDRNRQAPAVGAGHDGVHFGINGSAGWDSLSGRCEGKAESRKKQSQS